MIIGCAKLSGLSDPKWKILNLIDYMKHIVLKKGKEGIFHQRHHWIFSGAIETYPDNYHDGQLVEIRSSTGKILGYGFFNQKVSLAGRIISFGEGDPYDAMKENLKNALALRKPLLDSSHTTACRLINGEGDAFPGLIIDKYGPYLVTQTGALGMHNLLPFFIEQLQTLLPIQGIYDKSKGSSIKEEGLEPQEKVIFGQVPDTIEILEQNIRYQVAPKNRTKNGLLFRSKRDARLGDPTCQRKKVLNGFSYTGGFTLAALKGGAHQVDSVDISGSAIEACRAHIALNGFSNQSGTLFQQDVFDFLEENPCDYDLVILDPPAFAKKKKDIPSAIKGYKRIFGLALQKMPPSSQLLLSSCSHYITNDIFENIVRTAALEAGRTIKIIGHHRLALDHPINPFHPESAYLKSLLLHINDDNYRDRSPR